MLEQYGGNMVNDTTATTEAVSSKKTIIWSPTKFAIWSPASPKPARYGGAAQVSSVSLCSGRTLAWNHQLKQQQQYHQAHPWHHHLFGRTQPSVHCLIGHGGAAERKDSGASGKQQKASTPKQYSIVQPQPGQDKDPKSD